MPRYDYQCELCQAIFEVKASITEKEAGLKPVCPACQSQSTRQVITSGLILHTANTGSGSISNCGPNAGPGCCG